MRAVRRRRLSGSHDFTRIWLAGTVSCVGTAVTAVALPTVALITLRASLVEVGMVAAAGQVAWIALGLSAGVWVERLPRRPVLIGCDVVRALALGSVPVAAAVGVLTIGQLVVVALLIGTGTVFFDIASQTYLPAILEPAELLAGNSRLQASDAAAQTAGPALGGGLVQLLGAPLTLITDAVGYVASALLLGTVRQRESPVTPAVTARMPARIREGLSYVSRDPVVRPLMLVAASMNLVNAGFDTLIIPFLLHDVDIAPAGVGVLLASGGIGAVIGATACVPLANTVGSARALLLAVSAGPLLALLVPLASKGIGLALFGVGLLGLQAGITTVSVLARSHRQLTVPPELLARVTASIKFVSWGVLPIGALGGGALGQWLGARTALWIVCVLLLFAASPVWLSPLRGHRELADSDIRTLVG